MNTIVIRGAKENNLKNIDLVIPRNKVVCFVGVSGSGKSTIAFDIIAREGERQYFESLPSYARRYLHKSNRPLVDEIKGVSASIVISQDRVRGNPRSTVGTLTEAYTYLRLLYSRVGLPSMDSSYYSFNHPYGACKKCKGLGRAVEVNESKVIDKDKSLNEGAILPSDWYVGGRQWSIVKATGYFDMNKKLCDYDAEEIEKILYAPPEMLQSVSGEFIDRWTFQGVVHRIIHRNNNTHRSLSENDMRYFDLVDCLECHGGRLNSKSLDVRLQGKNIGEVANMPLEQCLAFIKSIDHKNAQAIKPRLIDQLQGLINVGVGYLSLNRSADTLSGGEAQRVKMARQLSCDLIETVYVLDEPTAGLHPRDVSHVVANLQRLRNNGNTVIVVEHDETVIRSADHIVEVGPGGGKHGGQIVASCTIDELIVHEHSLTGTYLNKSKCMGTKEKYRRVSSSLTVTGATRHNLKNIDVSIPTGVLVALTGVSGSGKSSLVEEIKSQHANKIVLIDQSIIGANRRGCIATYVGIFDYIRTLFAHEHGLHPSLFSFNSHGGCELCKGVGYIDMDMNFLGDVKIKCESCGGSRYKEKVLRYSYKGKNIVEVLAMTASEMKQFFDSADIQKPMSLLEEVGLDYIEMGQTLDTLSGGESQRLKLASKLQAKGEFYILDEPTSGLHFADIEKLLRLLNRLVDNGNTVLIIEHNLDLIKNADWVIDLGPEGGEKGGTIVAQGTPIQIARTASSYTGVYLKRTLNI
ncbi:MAG: excinuclease ABC subunit UvrA [Candidatus Roizmanbacteria bacterium]|nr:excinuclease ABC subunit UvrA [Candidatus Roizmanbacteria bacterium]